MDRQTAMTNPSPQTPPNSIKKIADEIRSAADFIPPTTEAGVNHRIRLRAIATKIEAYFVDQSRALPSLAELERDAIRFAAVKPDNYTSLEEWRAAVDAAVEAEGGTKLRHTCGEQASCAPCEEEDRLAARAKGAKRQEVGR